MTQWPDDARLFATLATNALLIFSSWRIASRHNRRFVVALPDTILLWLAAQYVITGVCGMLGILTPGVMLMGGCAWSIMALLISARTNSPSLAVEVEWGDEGRLPPESDRRVQLSHAPSPGLSREGRGFLVPDAQPLSRPPSRFRISTVSRESLFTLLALTFAIAYAGAYFLNQRWLPQLATDAIVYHTPAATQWLANERIGLVDFWYWLPDNTYSPLAGSVWIAWWLGPIGNDSLARFVQFPVWVLLLTSLIRLLRDLRVSPALAAIVALAIVLSRPFISQLIIAKDDIAVAALAITLLGAMHPRRVREGSSAVRIGITLGLLMSIKYTAALAVPVLLPAIVLFRWKLFGIKRVLIAGSIAIAFVAPWLIRNALLTGNPFFPIGSGGTTYLSDPDLRSFVGIYHTLARSHHALPIAMWAIGIAAIAMTAWLARRTLLRDPIRLSIVIGPPLAIVLLVLLFPFSEIRYLFTALAAGMLSIGILLANVRQRVAAIVIALIVLGISIGTSFNIERFADVSKMMLAGTTASAIIAVTMTFYAARTRTMIACIAAGALCVLIYVKWVGYLRHPDAGYQRGTDEAWIERYGDVALIWYALRANVPAGSTIAYANTPTIWPLFGFDRQFRVVYAPMRPGITHLHDLPRVNERVPARDEYVVATKHLTDGAEAQTWLENLSRVKADYLFIAKHESSDAPPELKFIAQNPDRFERMAENDAAIIFRIRK